MIANSKKIFEIALNLTQPLEVKEVVFELVEKKKELHIHLGFNKGQ